MPEPNNIDIILIHDHLTSKSGSLQSALSPFLFACAHGPSQHPLVKCCRSLSKLSHFSAFQWLVTTGSPLILGNYVLSCPVSLTGSLITSLESRKELLSQHICTSHCANQTVLTCSHHWLLCDQKALSRTVWKSDRTVATTETDSEVFRVVFVLRNRFKQQLQWHLAAGGSLHRLGAKHAILGGRSTSLVKNSN